MNDNRYAPPNAPVGDPSASGVVVTTPVAVRRATALLWASLAVGLANTALEWTYLTSVSSTRMIAAILTLTFVLIGWLTYNIGRGKNWARIVLLLLGLIGLPSLAQLPVVFARAPASGALSLLQSVMQFIGLYIVFVTSARHWFGNRGSARQPVQPDRA